MAKFRDVVLPDDLNEELILALESIPDAPLVEFGRRLPGGFTKASAVRQRLAISIRSPQSLDVDVAEMILKHGPLAGTIAALSTHSLIFFYEWIVALAGREPVLLKMLLDNRDEVRAHAARQLAEKPVPPTEGDIKAGRDLLTHFVQQTLIAPLGLTLVIPKTQAEGESVAVPRPVGVEDPAAVRRLKDELQKQSERHKKEIAAIRDKAATEIAQAKHQASETQGRQSRLEQQIARLEAEITRLRSEQEQAIADGVGEQTSAVVRKWLEPALAVEQERRQGAATACDLLAKAEAALQEQASRDQHCGNRRHLQDRLTGLENMRTRLETAAREALVSVPSVAVSLAALKAEITRLHKLLNGGAPPDDLPCKLLLQINQASDWEHVHRLEELVQSLSDNGLLPGPHHRRIYQQLQRKYTLLDETAPARHPVRAENGWSLRRAVHDNTSCVLLLDGHNILFQLKDVFGVDAKGIPDEHARRKLERSIQKLAGPRPELRVTLWFDGPHPRTKNLAPNIAVSFSGGEGAHRADMRIKESLKLNTLSDLNRKAFVVSDDREVRRETKAAGGLYVPVGLFAVLLEDFSCFG